MNTNRVACSLILAFLLSLPIFAQDRRAIPADGGGSRSVQGGRGSVGVAPVANTGTAVGTASTGSGRNTGVPSTSNATSSFIPSLKGTSFISPYTYFMWQDFYLYLQTRYMLDPFYFNRFFADCEPLVTPYLMKVAMREPLRMSMQMLSLSDELEALVQARQAGKPVSKEEIAAKAQGIRELANKLRHDRSLGFIDQRKDQDLIGNDGGLDAVYRLHQMVVDLNTQLKAMYRETSTSTVSVDTLTQPSFGSLSKGIEKLSRSIENSAHGL